MARPTPLAVLESLAVPPGLAGACEQAGASPSAGVSPPAEPSRSGEPSPTGEPAGPSSAFHPGVPMPPGPGRSRPRYRLGFRRRFRRRPLRGRHVREHRLVRVGVALAAADIAVADDLLVLQVLRLQPLGDLDAAQVAALAVLPPSVVASALDRLVRSGLARDRLVGGRVRFGLP